MSISRDLGTIFTGAMFGSGGAGVGSSLYYGGLQGDMKAGVAALAFTAVAVVLTGSGATTALATARSGQGFRQDCCLMENIAVAVGGTGGAVAMISLVSMLPK
ncbi:MAG: hypothetical protein H6868_08465 [Rhodospirillales bacterium]|nr:hypothetical protein [Rhodospirillales bacterium]